MKQKKIIIEIIIAVIVLVFAYTGTSKLMDFTHFKVTLGKSPFLSSFAYVIAIVLPPIELLTAAALATRKFRLHALYFTFFLMSLFTCYIYTMLYYGSDLPCSCGGVLAKMSWPTHLVFNSVLTALTGIVIIFYESIKTSFAQ